MECKVSLNKPLFKNHLKVLAFSPRIAYNDSRSNKNH